MVICDGDLESDAMEAAVVPQVLFMEVRVRLVLMRKITHDDDITMMMAMVKMMMVVIVIVDSIHA